MDNMNPGKPASFNNNSDKPIPLPPDDAENKGVSHSPLDLGGSRPVQVNQVPKPQPQSRPAAAPVQNAPVNSNFQTVSAGKITGVKTFFTRLHAGALDFMDEQIMDWIKNNPDKDIKMVQTTVGEIQAKKTEPGIIVTIWY